MERGAEGDKTALPPARNALSTKILSAPLLYSRVAIVAVDTGGGGAEVAGARVTIEAATMAVATTISDITRGATIDVDEVGIRSMADVGAIRPRSLQNSLPKQLSPWKSHNG